MTDESLREQYAELIRIERERAELPQADRQQLEAGDAPLLRIQLLHMLERARLAEDENARLRAEPQPAKRTRSGLDEMYAERRAAEIERLRGRMAKAIAGDATRPTAERIGIINAVLALRELQRPFEERDRLRGNAHYWIDYASAYAEAKERAEAAVARVHQALEDAKGRGATGMGFYMAVRDALNGPTKQAKEQP